MADYEKYVKTEGKKAVLAFDLDIDLLDQQAGSA